MPRAIRSMAWLGRKSVVTEAVTDLLRLESLPDRTGSLATLRHPPRDFRHIPSVLCTAHCHADFSHIAFGLPDPAAGFRSIQ
jgi:hypothetical protein